MQTTDDQGSLVPVLEVRNLSKSYGKLKAVESVSFALRSGQVTALVGDNGAGKSTVVKMIAGALVPDSGEIVIGDTPVRIPDPISARHFGIETVYQDLAVLPNLDVITNLYIGREIYRRGAGRFLRMVNRRAMLEQARVLLADLDIKISSLRQPVGSLSGGQRQSVAIGRALAFASKVLIMDEPTAALGVAESAAVLRLVNHARDRGLAVLIISHILPHVIDLADQVVVMRHGRVVGVLGREETTQQRLVELIVGQESAFLNS